MLHGNRQLAPNPLLAGNHSSADALQRGWWLPGESETGTPPHRGEAPMLQFENSNAPGQWGRVCSRGHSKLRVWGPTAQWDSRSPAVAEQQLLLT